MKQIRAIQKSFLIFGFLFFALTAQVLAAGDLDATFTAGVTTFGSAANVVVVQTDGRVLVGGNFRVVNGRSSPGLVRLNADGTIDQSFNIGTGVNPGGSVNAIAVQPDGKILVGGAFNEFNGAAILLLVRLNTDGSLDTNFNMGGAGFPAIFSMVNAIALESDGQILIGGFFGEYNGTTISHFARLNSNGSLDTTFATNLGTGFDQTVNTIAVESDGQIVVGGNFSTVNGTTANRIVRLNGSGTLDTAFTTNGGTGFSGFFVFKVLLQANGQILVGGRFDEFNGTPRTDLLRLNADGSLDTNFTPSANGNVLDLLIQPNGQIIAAGNASFGAMQERTFLARLNQADGSLDSTFDAGTTFFNTNGAISSIAFQLDGSIFAAGNFITFSGVVRSALANLNGTTGSLNAGFTTVIGVGGQVNDLLVLPDNKIIIAGLFSGVNESFRESVARLNADGSMDTTFNAGLGAVSGSVNTLAVQPLDGKIIVGGSFQMFGGENRLGIVRLNTDGSIDATFNVSVSIFVEAIAIQPDGKIVIGGGFNVARLNADGTTDATFNTGTGFDGNVEAVILQSNGQILVGGSFTTYNGTAGVNDLARLNSTGTLDSAFSTNIGTGSDGGIYSLALQTDGRIVVGGFFSNFNGTSSGSIVRLNTDGTRDTNFNVGGAGFDGNVNDLALQPDGRILAGGFFGDYSGTVRLHLARLRADGTLDTSFTSGGAPNNPLNAVGVQCDGRILIGGLLESYGGIPRFGIARVTAGDTITWTGAADMNWNNAANWSTGFVPTSTDNAIIPNGFIVNLSGTNSSVLTLTVGAGSMLTIAAASSLTAEGVTNTGTIAGVGTLNVIGTALTNTGTISASAVNVNLNMNCAGFSPTQSKALIGTGAFVGNILTVASGVTLALQGDHQFNQINIQGTLNATSRTINLRGANPLQGAGSVILTFSTVIFDGTAAQSNSHSVNFNNLTINNPAGVTFGNSGSFTVAGTLDLQNGILNMSSPNFLYFEDNAATIRTNGYVIGAVRKNYSAAGLPAFTFPIGTANGYSPVTVHITSGTTQVTANVAQTNQPNLNPAFSLSRYWTLSGSGTFTASLTFNYFQTDVFGNESSYQIARVTGGVPQYFANNCGMVSPCVNTATNTAFISGVTAFSDWTVGELAPLAAEVSIGGRVLNAFGRGIGKTVVTLTDQTGASRNVLTSSFGYYKFNNLESGETYIISVNHKRFVFNPNSMVITPSENVENADFTASP